MKIKNSTQRICLAVFLISGCSTEGEVSRKWSSSMRELGIYPIFPPSADYRVGDVRTIPLCEYEDTKSKYPGIGLLAGSLEPFLLATTAASSDPVLSDTLAQRISTRAALPDYAASSVGASGSSAVFIPTTPPLAGSTQIPLAQVAFPGFVNVTAHGGDISALFPVSGLPVPVGANFSSNATANVNIRGGFKKPK